MLGWCVIRTPDINPEYRWRTSSIASKITPSLVYLHKIAIHLYQSLAAGRRSETYVSRITGSAGNTILPFTLLLEGDLDIYLSEDYSDSPIAV